MKFQIGQEVLVPQGHGYVEETGVIKRFYTNEYGVEIAIIKYPFRTGSSPVKCLTIKKEIELTAILTNIETGRRFSKHFGSKKELNQFLKTNEYFTLDHYEERGE